MPRGIREPWDAETLARAAGMKRAGITNAMIAKRLGVTESCVSNKLSKAKVKRRLDGRSGTGRLGYGRIHIEAVDTRRQTEAELGTSITEEE